jgi:putative oxidoreductase
MISWMPIFIAKIRMYSPSSINSRRSREMKEPSTVNDSPAQLGAALLRISLGVMWIAHALLKWFVFTLAGTAQFFESVGFAGWMAYPVFAAELIGGIMILTGIYARQVSLVLVPVMLAAAWVHLPNGWLHTSKGGGWEYPVFLVASSVAHWLIGDGAWSLKRSVRWTPSAAAA